MPNLKKDKGEPRAKPQAKKGKKKGKVSFKTEVRQRLLKAREAILAEVAEKVKAESDVLKFEIGDIYDIASSERDRELSLILGDREREKLAEIEDALERLSNGTYGLCEECGEPIGEERMRVMPFTKVCIDCKSRNEKERGARRRYEEEIGFGVQEKVETEEDEF
ncbi:MAG: TraR/DksA family transcriptional regulator [Deltaproteobacteria bacterium]|nr:TraR/DksA family transcriptional regulator [Deltaproteobacteria bacterium]